MAYKFITPTVSEGPAGLGPLFSRYRLNRGVSVGKLGDQYYELRYPTEDEIAGFSKFYRGGYEHIVDDATAAELQALGYTVVAL